MQTDNPYKTTKNYLRYHLRYNNKQVHSIIARYGKFIGNKKDKYVDKRYYDMVCFSIQKEWSKFMEFYGTIKKDYPAIRPIQPRNSKHAEWIKKNITNGKEKTTMLPG